MPVEREQFTIDECAHMMRADQQLVRSLVARSMPEDSVDIMHVNADEQCVPRSTIALILSDLGLQRRLTIFDEYRVVFVTRNHRLGEMHNVCRPEEMPTQMATTVAHASDALHGKKIDCMVILLGNKGDWVHNAYGELCQIALDANVQVITTNTPDETVESITALMTRIRHFVNTGLLA